MLRKCLYFCILLSMSIVACGSPDQGLMSTSLVDGKEASQRINAAAVTGSVLCAARTGTTAQIIFSAETDAIYSIDAGRAYKEKDVKKCEDNIKLTTALSTNCSPNNLSIAFVPTCKLSPVDKITGS